MTRAGIWESVHFRIPTPLHSSIPSHTIAVHCVSFELLINPCHHHHHHLHCTGAALLFLLSNVVHKPKQCGKRYGVKETRDRFQTAQRCRLLRNRLFFYIIFSEDFLEQRTRRQGSCPACFRRRVGVAAAPVALGYVEHPCNRHDGAMIYRRYRIQLD